MTRPNKLGFKKNGAINYSSQVQTKIKEIECHVLQAAFVWQKWKQYLLLRNGFLPKECIESQAFFTLACSNRFATYLLVTSCSVPSKKRIRNVNILYQKRNTDPGDNLIFSRQN